MRVSTFYKCKNYFHVAVTYQAHALLKELDWVFVQNSIIKQTLEFNIEVQSLVMMDTHLHMIIRTTEPNENYFCAKLQHALSPFESVDNLSEPILSYAQYLNTYKYIYRNPVAAGLCHKVEDYSFSSLKNLLGRAGPMRLPVYDQLGLIQNAVQRLHWLNTSNSYKYSEISWTR